MFHRLHETKAEFSHGIIQRALFFRNQVALRFFLQHGQQVDVVPGQIEVGLLFLFARRFFPKAACERQKTQIQFSLQAQRVDEKVEVGRRKFRAIFRIEIRLAF